MPIWGEVELLCRAIMEESQKEEETILAQAKAQMEGTLTEAQRQAREKYEEEMVAKRAWANLEARRIIDSADLQARKRTMAFREQVIGEAFAELEEQLEKFMQGPTYAEFLFHAIIEGLENLSGSDFIIELNEKDMELVSGNIESIAEETGRRVELKASPSLEGGPLIYTGDGRMLYDNTLMARFNRRRDEIRREIWGALFGTDAS